MILLSYLVGHNTKTRNIFSDYFSFIYSCIFSAGGSIPGQDEDISPYATFHLLGMREEAKNGRLTPTSPG